MSVAQKKKLVDVQEVRRAYTLLVAPGQVVELRALKASRDGNSRYTSTMSGYFDDVERLIQHVQQIRVAKGIYITLQACHPDLLDRAENKLIQGDRNATTSDKHITRYRWLLIDSDPGGADKISNISSTDAEHAQALAHSQLIAEALSTLGWPAPIRADSGNGAHLLYRIDLPPSDSDLVKRVLEGLAKDYNTDTIHIDQAVYNPARICKLYGTLACKGDDTERRPHRMSRLLSIPGDIQCVPREQLESIAAVPPPSEELPTRHYHAGMNGYHAPTDFLDRYHVRYQSPKQIGGKTVYVLSDGCVFDRAHTGQDAAVIVSPDGSWGYHCFHDSCVGKGWREFRLHFEPDAYQERNVAKSKTEAPAPIPASPESNAQTRVFCPIPAVDAALKTRDVLPIYEHAPDIAQLADVDLKRLRVSIRRLWKQEFPMREFDDLIAAERRKFEQDKRRMPAIGSARELMGKQFAPINWIVPGILPQGLIVLAGKQKIGKSWLDYNLGLSVASGGLALGSVQVEQGDVLYLALEDNERRLQDRFMTLLAPGEVIPEGLEYATEWPRMDETGLSALEAWIIAHPKARLIIIDPWVKVKPRIRPRAGETGYDADYEALEGLKRLSDTYKLCILVQFHLRKAGADDPFDELNATTGVTACADGFLSLKRGRGEADATLWGTGRDYKEDVDLALSFNSGVWNVMGPAEAYALTKASKEVIDVLHKEGSPMQPKSIAQVLGKTEGAVRKLLFDMKEKGEVQKTDDGYIPLVASVGNGGNASNGGNGGNEVTQAAQNVTSSPKRYKDKRNEVTRMNKPVEPVEGHGVTSVTSVTSTHQQNDHDSETQDDEEHPSNILVMPQKHIHAITRCETRFDLQMSENHQPGQQLATDAVGNHWCEHCDDHRRLIDLGVARGWPLLTLDNGGRRVKLSAGETQYLKFARTAGHRLVKIALQQLEAMKDTK